jgi:hypothetical protein
VIDHLVIHLLGDAHRFGEATSRLFSRFAPLCLYSCGLISLIAQATRITADNDPVRSRARVLRELIHDSLYVVDERAVADAIAARALVRQVVAEPSFRSELRGPQPRSFRRDPRARSFRLSSVPSLGRLHH